MSTASAYIADISKPDELAKNFSLIGLAWGVGLVLGPALGGFLGQVGLRLPAFAACGLSLLNLLLGFFWLPESLSRERRQVGKMRAGDFNPFAAIKAMGRIPGLGILLAVLCLFNFGANGMNSTESLFLIQKFTAQPWQIGLLQVLVGIVIALVQALVPKLVPRFGEAAVAITCLGIQGLGALAVSFNPIFLLIYPIILLRSGASGFIYSTLGSLNSKRVPPSEQGILSGVTTALNIWESDQAG